MSREWPFSVSGMDVPIRFDSESAHESRLYGQTVHLASSLISCQSRTDSAVND